MFPTNCGDKTGDSKCINNVACCLEDAKKAESFANYQCDDSKDDESEPQCTHYGGASSLRSFEITFVLVLVGMFFL